tara:strand:+ start:14336 stop:14536 length:201 start_codon:yes stop_codon:yes gene_type:complete
MLNRYISVKIIDSIPANNMSELSRAKLIVESNTRLNNKISSLEEFLNKKGAKLKSKRVLRKNINSD